ncbi:MAG: ABC transporter permease [Planctomycetota bacterium]|jgi:ABC-type antimicrobial peptide transport system permease subunit|nr:multidrug ABC transporter permease [Planctomycetota bacterium]MDP6837897.1 ABC transporter permease [Planctomycetota bacterium]MDP6954409.1 ABC transporter permease [Planctomycetota bacterium]
MLKIPLRYHLRSLYVRRGATALTILGVGATVAVLAGVLALEQGFATLFSEGGRPDVAVMMRPGATNEGDSIFSRERGEALIKSLEEIAVDGNGQPLAALESFLAVRLFKVEGGETNVPIRGVQPGSFAIGGAGLVMDSGRTIEFGTDEVIVGSSLTSRIQNCRTGDVIVLNTTPFRVVGSFSADGPASSEIWGDLDRLGQALERRSPSRILARLRPGTDLDALAERLENHPTAPAKVMGEAEYLSSQTAMLSIVLTALGGFLALVMGVGAVFTSTNTMLAALAARSHEIGVLRALGYRPLGVFLGFLLESLLLGLGGGLVGCLFASFLSGVETGTTNFQTFTEVAFAFRVTPSVLLSAVTFSLALGLIGGAWPAWRAARLSPTAAMRRG